MRRRAPGTMLGCDLELVEPRSDAFLADYFTADEQALVALAPAVERDKVVNLLWSAKESALKALGVGTAPGFPQRECSLGRRLLVNQVIDPIASQACLSRQLRAPMAGMRYRCDYTGGHVFQGWWQQTESLLRTTVAYPAPEQPVPLTISHS